MTDKAKKTEGNVTYSEVLFLNGILPRINILELHDEIKMFIHKQKKDLLPVVYDFESNRDFIYLMNGGIEETNQQGSKYLTEPKYELRSEFKGSDEEFKAHVLKIQKIKKTIYEELNKLGYSMSSYKLVPSLTEEQFEELLKGIPSTDLYYLKDRICKSST